MTLRMAVRLTAAFLGGVLLLATVGCDQQPPDAPAAAPGQGHAPGTGGGADRPRDKAVPPGERAAGAGEEPPGNPPPAPVVEAAPGGGRPGDEPLSPGVESLLAEMLAGVDGRYGVYFRVLAGKEEIAVRADEPFFAASCYKVPLVLCLYERALDGQVDLEEKLVYTEDHYQGGAGILRDEKPGSAYDLRYLASLAIVDSDNIAARMLFDRLGPATMEQYHRDLGAGGVDLWRNLASPRDVALVLERLLILAGQRPEHFGEILAWMEVSYPRDRIPLGLPDGVRVANKTGTWRGVLNDAALIFLEHGVAVLVVMSEGVSTYGQGTSTIAAIARTIYSELAGKLGDREPPFLDSLVAPPAPASGR